MRFNWGTGIVIALIIMISGMIYLVSIAIRQDYDLVDKDYYQKSEKYQDHIEKVKNTEALAVKITFKQSEDSLHLNFPNVSEPKDYTGSVHFYSPVEEKRDLIIPIKLNSVYSQLIDLSTLEKGRYSVKIDWSANKTDYYQEEEITVKQ
jgi:nitrogen fixation protein FixH